jgi:hypothetical protein
MRDECASFPRSPYDRSLLEVEIGHPRLNEKHHGEIDVGVVLIFWPIELGQFAVHASRMRLRRFSSFGLCQTCPHPSFCSAPNLGLLHETSNCSEHPIGAIETFLDGDCQRKYYFRPRKSSGLVFCQVQVERGGATDGWAEVFHTNLLAPFNDSAGEATFFEQMDVELNKVS